MIRPIFSTLACPDWTLERVCVFAAQHGYAGVECRTAGSRGGEFAPDPALTDAQKVRDLFDDHAIELAGLASGLTFDRPIQPPVLGRLLPAAAQDVNEGRSLIDIAASVGAGFVRVYPFRMHGRERRSSALVRICDRLAKVCDHTRHRGVRILIENAGDFGKADDLRGIIASVRHPNLAAAYDPAYAMLAGDDPVEGVRTLAGSLELLRLRDHDAAGHPVTLGSGVLPSADLVAEAANAAADAFISTTWDRAWLDDLPGAEEAIAHDAERIYHWAGRAASTSAA